MSTPISIPKIEALLATPSGGWRIEEMTSTHSALPALLRLARAAEAAQNHDCPCRRCGELRAALGAFEFGEGSAEVPVRKQA